MAVNKYDDASLRNIITHAPSATGLSVPGTAASDTVILRIPIAGHDVQINRLRLRMTTGGTAAGPTITVGKSLAGTGAVVACGTFAFGTSANGATGSANLTTTNFSEGDEIVISNLAGTAASTPVIVFSLAYKDV